jgi:adenylate cyclase
MHMTHQPQAIMFADVSGSSALYRRLGNVQAKAIIDKALTYMVEYTVNHGGVVVKTIGDEIMARFDSADAACCAACAIQQACLNQTGSDAVALRIGIAYGPALLDNNDVFGDTVNDAAYVAHIARANQILLSESVVNELGAEPRHRCQEFDRINIKGASNDTLIYRLQWETPTQNHSATTVMSLKEVARHLETYKLRLRVADKTDELLPDQTPFVIGRDPVKTDLHVDSTLASRDHCHIVFQHGKYVLIDHSTNGTYVSNADQPAIYLRRGELPLFGTGSISLGLPIGRAGEWLIHYEL